MKTPLKAKFSRAAFTVVELIIVISVIGILASIAVGSYAGTRNKADKSSYNATAQQIKMKLGEFFTDNNHYPADKTALRNYLDSVGSNTIADELSSTYYSYGTWSSSAKGSCAGNVTNCQYYEITVQKVAWKGDATDNNIVVKP